jgi:hypothetical protein
VRESTPTGRRGLTGWPSPRLDRRVTPGQPRPWGWRGHGSRPAITQWSGRKLGCPRAPCRRTAIMATHSCVRVASSHATTASAPPAIIARTSGLSQRSPALISAVLLMPSRMFVLVVWQDAGERAQMRRGKRGARHDVGTGDRLGCDVAVPDGRVVALVEGRRPGASRHRLIRQVRVSDIASHLSQAWRRARFRTGWASTSRAWS